MSKDVAPGFGNLEEPSERPEPERPSSARPAATTALPTTAPASAGPGATAGPSSTPVTFIDTLKPESREAPEVVPSLVPHPAVLRLVATMIAVGGFAWFVDQSVPGARFSEEALTVAESAGVVAAVITVVALMWRGSSWRAEFLDLVLSVLLVVIAVGATTCLVVPDLVGPPARARPAALAAAVLLVQGVHLCRSVQWERAWLVGGSAYRWGALWILLATWLPPGLCALTCRTLVERHAAAWKQIDGLLQPVAGSAECLLTAQEDPRPDQKPLLPARWAVRAFDPPQLGWGNRLATCAVNVAKKEHAFAEDIARALPQDYRRGQGESAAIEGRLRQTADRVARVMARFAGLKGVVPQSVWDEFARDLQNAVANEPKEPVAPCDNPFLAAEARVLAAATTDELPGCRVQTAADFEHWVWSGLAKLDDLGTRAAWTGERVDFDPLLEKDVHTRGGPMADTRDLWLFRPVPGSPGWRLERGLELRRLDPKAVSQAIIPGQSGPEYYLLLHGHRSLDAVADQLAQAWRIEHAMRVSDGGRCGRLLLVQKARWVMSLGTGGYLVAQEDETRSAEDGGDILWVSLRYFGADPCAEPEIGQ